MANPPRSKPNKPDQTQAFKSAMGATVRAIGAKPDLEVSFTADRPLLTSDKARLANLPRLPTKRDIAIARGQGDAMAMRLASHDPEAHRKRAPMDPQARAAFDALEQARVESLGCIRMPGMVGNIHEMLEDRLFRANFAEVDDKGDAPLAEALGLMLRERLAGVEVPPSGHALVDLWRKEIEAKAGPSIEKLLDTYESQEDFSRAARAVLRDLNLIAESDMEDPSDSDEEASEDNQPEQAQGSEKDQEQGEGENEQSESEDDQQAGESEESGDVEGMEADMADSDEDAEAEAVPAAQPGAETPMEKDLMGMSLSSITPELAEQLGLDADASGLVVRDVDQASEAYEKGLRAGDLITEAGQQTVESITDLEDRVAEAKDAGRKSILLLIRREGEPRFVALPIAD